MNEAPLKSKIASRKEMIDAFHRIKKLEGEIKRLDGVLQQLSEICVMAQGHIRNHESQNDRNSNSPENDENIAFAEACRSAKFTSYREAAVFFYKAKCELQDLYDDL